MFRFVKRLILEHKYSELISRLNVSERAARVYADAGLDEFVQAEKEYQEKMSSKLVKVCIALNELGLR